MSEYPVPGEQTAPAVLSALQEYGPLDVGDLRIHAAATARSVELALDLLQQSGQVQALPEGRYQAT